MTTVEWKHVGTALLGSWPSQVASWGAEAIAAYIAELAARDVSPRAALTAIRSCGPDTRFPPSAPELAGLARRDPGRPTWPEAYQLLYGPGGVFRARPVYKQGGWRGTELAVATDRVQLERAEHLSPFLAEFVRSVSLRRLRTIELDDPQYGPVRQRELATEWDRFCAVNEDREIAQIAGGRSGRLGRIDPLAALNASRREIEAGDRP